MISRIVFFTAISSLAAGCVVTSDQDGSYSTDVFDIVGGSDVDIAEYPWQISLQGTWGGHFCGGSVIRDTWVLTAQHCVAGESPGNLRIAAGMSNLSAASQGQVRSVAEIILYPGYTTASSGKDVALIRLAAPLDLSLPGISAIHLVTPEEAALGLTNPGVISTVTGWGSLSAGGPSSDRLQAVDVPIVSQAEASAAYKREGFALTEDQLAAGVMGIGGKDSCQGDSGGPLVVFDGTGRARLGGVVSWGIGCAEADYPGLYARVSSFAPWIASMMNSVLHTALQESGLAGIEGVFVHYPVVVPEGALTFTANLAGGTGDADLYVKYGGQPTTTRFDCRSSNSNNSETCSFDMPSAGTWYVSVRGYSSYADATLTATYRTSTTTP